MPHCLEHGITAADVEKRIPLAREAGRLRVFRARAGANSNRPLAQSLVCASHLRFEAWHKWRFYNQRLSIFGPRGQSIRRCGFQEATHPTMPLAGLECPDEGLSAYHN